MSNPNGPYPGRQIFTGLTDDGNPSLAYLVTGRSPQSRERFATLNDNTVIMGPLGDVPYDPLRHYTALQYDSASGIMAVSNGIQTQAIFETYKLIYNTGTEPTPAYMKLIMEGAAYEPDSLHTPRISAIITRLAEKSGSVQIMSIITDNGVAMAIRVAPEKGKMTGISTYTGGLEDPIAFDSWSELPKISVKASTAAEIAEYVYEISQATNNGEDIRVCAVGGVLKDSGWELALVNAHKK